MTSPELDKAEPVALAEWFRSEAMSGSYYEYEQRKFRDAAEALTHLTSELAASRERERALERVISACQWYWPEDDTSSECCSDNPYGVMEGLWDYRYGDVIGISRGGVVETRYHAWLEPADDADSDDNFEVDEATRDEAKAKIDAELERRRALADANTQGGSENG